MTWLARTRAVLALAVALLLATTAIASADQSYDKVANAYAQAGGQLDPCAFTQAELEAAIRGIPPTIRDVVPALRRAMQDGVAAHKRGDCRGVRPDEGTTGGATPGAPGTTTPPVTTTPAPATTPPVQTAPSSTVPTTVEPAPSTTPAPATTPTESAVAGPRERDRTPLLVALIALGALLLLALLLWAIARARGWDPGWAARTRHAWGEAGFRSTNTWAEFTDWLRLGR